MLGCTLLKSNRSPHTLFFKFENLSQKKSLPSSFSPQAVKFFFRMMIQGRLYGFKTITQDTRFLEKVGWQHMIKTPFLGFFIFWVHLILRWAAHPNVCCRLLHLFQSCFAHGIMPTARQAKSLTNSFTTFHTKCNLLIILCLHFTLKKTLYENYKDRCSLIFNLCLCIP